MTSGHKTARRKRRKHRRKRKRKTPRQTNNLGGKHTPTKWTRALYRINKKEFDDREELKTAIKLASKKIREMKHNSPTKKNWENMKTDAERRLKEGTIADNYTKRLNNLRATLNPNNPRERRAYYSYMHLLINSMDAGKDMRNMKGGVRKRRRTQRKRRTRRSKRTNNRK